jgi:2-dehydro-3-deoxyphosphogalactonate aldolase
MTTPLEKFSAAMRELPLVAILRGLAPAEAADVGDAIVEPGFRLLEVPLNSPQPLESIALMRQRFSQALVGAGTVLGPPRPSARSRRAPPGSSCSPPSWPRPPW